MSSTCIFCVTLFFLCWFIVSCKRANDRRRAEERREYLASLNLEGSERRQAAVNFVMTQLNTASERQPDQQTTRTDLIEKCISTVEVKDVKEVQTLIAELRCANTTGDGVGSKSTRRVVSIAWNSARDSIRSNSSLSIRSNSSLSIPECSICLEAYEKGDKISSAKIDTCIHVFHEECLTLWLKENDDCPLCRCNILGCNHTSNDVEMASVSVSVSDSDN